MPQGRTMVAIRFAAAAAVLLVAGAFHLRPGSVLQVEAQPYLINFPFFPSVPFFPPVSTFPGFLTQNIPTSAPSWAITPPNVSNNIPMNCPPQSVIQDYLSGQTVNGAPAIPASCLPMGTGLYGGGAFGGAGGFQG